MIWSKVNVRTWIITLHTKLKKKQKKTRNFNIFTKYKILIYKLKIWWIHLWINLFSITVKTVHIKNYYLFLYKAPSLDCMHLLIFYFNVFLSSTIVHICHKLQVQWKIFIELARTLFQPIGANGVPAPDLE